MISRANKIKLQDALTKVIEVLVECEDEDENMVDGWKQYTITTKVYTFLKLQITYLIEILKSNELDL